MEHFTAAQIVWLIDTKIEKMEEFDAQKKCHDPLWLDISKQFNKQFQVEKNAKQIKTKWNKLYQQYVSRRKGLKSTGAGGMKEEWYDKIHAAYHERVIVDYKGGMSVAGGVTKPAKAVKNLRLRSPSPVDEDPLNLNDSDSMVGDDEKYRDSETCLMAAGMTQVEVREMLGEPPRKKAKNGKKTQASVIAEACKESASEQNAVFKEAVSNMVDHLKDHSQKFIEAMDRRTDVLEQLLQRMPGYYS